MMKPALQILIVLLVATAGCATDLSSARSRSRSIAQTYRTEAETSASPRRERAVKPTENANAPASKEPPLSRFANGSSTSKARAESDLQISAVEALGAGHSVAPIIESENELSTDISDVENAAISNAKKSSVVNLAFGFHDWTGITRDEIRAQALDHHPAVAQAHAYCESLRGKYQQAGLAPNPTAGIIGSEINENGGAGRYGVYFGREIVRGGKLNASQNAIGAELHSAGQRLEIVKRRLLTDVDCYYYEVLIAQEQLELAMQLEEISKNAVKISKSLFRGQEVPKTSVLQAELELRKSQMVTRRYKAGHLSATRKLAAIIGQEKLPTARVAGNAREIAMVEDFESAYDRLLRDSPELAKLFADIEANKRKLVRDQLEPISNVRWQTSFLYDFVSDDIIGGFQIGWEIPKFDRNQGAIYQSSQQVVAAKRKVETKALELRRRLAEAYERYLDAQIHVEAFENEILPIATETAELLTQGYQAGETEVLELLVAQRALFQTNLAYLQNLRVLSQQTAAIEGLLLDDGLADQTSSLPTGY